MVVELTQGGPATGQSDWDVGSGECPDPTWITPFPRLGRAPLALHLPCPWPASRVSRSLDTALGTSIWSPLLLCPVYTHRPPLSSVTVANPLSRLSDCFTSSSSALAPRALSAGLPVPVPTTGTLNTHPLDSPAPRWIQALVPGPALCGRVSLSPCAAGAPSGAPEMLSDARAHAAVHSVCGPWRGLV